MGLFDGLREVLGIRAEADATRKADPEDLFGMSTAYVTMEAELGYAPTGDAALFFSQVDNTDFADAVQEVRDILEVGEEETGTRTDNFVDDYGYSWIVLRDSDFEDLVTSLHFASDTLIERDYGSRLLGAMFAFEKDGEKVYWVYSFRRGAYYPLAPKGTNDRDSKAEFKLESNLDGELSIEENKEYWYALLPDKPGAHPWE